MQADGKRREKKHIKEWMQGAFGFPLPFSLFNQRRKTDMSNHNKTSAGKWAFAITVSQPPLERPPFLDINQRFMDWFPHSLFNYCSFFIYLTTEDVFMQLNHFFVGNHIFTSCLYLFYFFLSLPFFLGLITLFFLLCPQPVKAKRKKSAGPFTQNHNIAS